MFNLTFVSPITEIRGISGFFNDIVGTTYFNRSNEEDCIAISNLSKEVTIYAICFLCGMIQLEHTRGYELTYNEYDSLYDFTNIDRLLQLHSLTLNQFFIYFKLFQ